MTELAVAPGLAAAPERGLPERKRHRAVRLAVAVAVGAAVTAAGRLALPDRLRVHTDVVGYPIFADFNVFGLFRNFEFAALVFPGLVLAVYVVAGRLAGCPSGALRRRDRTPPADDPLVVDAGRGAVGRILFSGAVVGLELAFALRAERRFWTLVAAVAVAYAGAVALAGAPRADPLRRFSPAARRAVANAVGLAAVPLLLYLVSGSTRATDADGGSVHHLHWMPLWVAVALCGGALAWALRAVAGAESDAAAMAAERWAVLVVAGSAAVYLLVAFVPWPIGGLDFFHDGERLVGARLVLQGAFPWRDVLLVHGLVEDVLLSGIGMHVFGGSVWAGSAGLTLILSPLFWVGMYLLDVSLFHRSWLFLVLVTTLLLQRWLTPELTRIVLVPWFLLLLGALLRRATPARAAGFVVVGLASAVVTPESALAVLAGGVTVVAFETWYGGPGQALRERYRRTLLCAVSAVSAGALWCGYLAWNGALGAFFFSLRVFAPDHVLTGGIPVLGTGFDFWFAVLVPPAATVIYLWWFGARLAGRRPLTVADWVVAAVGLFTLLYYRKFLARADGHAFHPLTASLPLLYHGVYRLAGAAESALARLRAWRFSATLTRYPVALALVVLVVAATPGPPLGDVSRRLPTALDEVVPAPQERLGPSQADSVPPGLVHDVSLVLGTVLRPGDPVFDLSNNPALFHYLLDTPPATRYYDVSMAIRRVAQEDLIGELRRTRPKVVVLDGGYGLPTWDGVPNEVRHYEVSEYVLRRYRLLTDVRSFVILLRDDLPAPSLDAVRSRLTSPLTEGRDFLQGVRPCDWGYAPDFLDDPGPPAAGIPLPLATAPQGPGQDITVELPAGASRERMGRLVIESRRPLRRGTFTLTQAGSPMPPISFKATGRGGPRTVVEVGSCQQWYLFGDGPLLLRTDRPQDVLAVRLAP
ncbi:MAG TPA: hypothetical protein VFJ85_16825 [Acidimicrobiales bacterium]|nr:hypothetical protein [Acidimicrobiales bacterium]